MLWKILIAVVIWIVFAYRRDSRFRYRTGRGRTHGTASDGDFARRQDLEMQFLRYMFSMMAKLAKADGRINESEVRTAERVFATYSFAAKRRSFCARVFNEAKDNSRSIYWYADSFASIVRDRSTRLFLYDMLWDVACADGVLHPEERRILQRLCSFLRIPGSCFQENYARRFSSFSEDAVRTDPSDPYAILGCRRTDSNKVVKAAYRAAALKYHPDRLRQNGVPEEMIAKATSKMAEVNAAWDSIRKSRGI